MAKVLSFPDYRSFLRAELSERLSRNGGYSLRAFARDLEVAPSLLSSILSSTRPLTAVTAAQISDKLGMTGSEVEYLSTLVQFEREKTPGLRAMLQDRLRGLSRNVDREDMELDTFQAIVEWYHIPILVLVDIPGLLMNASAIANKLGITPLQAEAACDRLTRLGMLVKNPDGDWSRKSDNMHFGTELPNKALRHYHQRLLEKAAKALDEQLPADRYVGSETIAFHVSRMPRVRATIEKFRQELMQSATRPVAGDAPSNEVYQMGIAFFRVSKALERGHA